MNDKIIGLLITIATACVTAIITYTVNLRINAKNRQLDLLKEQKYKFFLPFKYYCNEFMYRLFAIEDKLSIKDPFRIQELKVSLDKKGLDWYFKSWENNENNISICGGYYFASTIYMNCLLYYRINLLQTEYPFLTVTISKQLKEIIESNNEQIKRCYDSVKDDKKLKKRNNLDGLLLLRGKVSIKKLIDELRVSTISNDGIPYSLHDSFGDFITENNEIINYEKFCKLLIDETSRIKFSPLLKYWNTLADENNENRLNQIRMQILVLKLIQETEIL